MGMHYFLFKVKPLDLLRFSQEIRKRELQENMSIKAFIENNDLRSAREAYDAESDHVFLKAFQVGKWFYVMVISPLNMWYYDTAKELGFTLIWADSRVGHMTEKKRQFGNVIFDMECAGNYLKIEIFDLDILVSEWTLDYIKKTREQNGKETTD